MEKRNAVCMTCGQVSPLSTRMSFETWRCSLRQHRQRGGTCLSPGGGTSGLSVDRGWRHPHGSIETEIADPQKTKIAAAIYLYQVDNDGSEWGEISFDFERGTAEVTPPCSGVGHIQDSPLCQFGDPELLNCNNKALPKGTWLVKEL